MTAITADAGGSNGYRSRVWKHELQKFADDLNLRIRVSHFPPGTSKWNKIEHRLFCHITQNWRGKPLRSFETIVETIGTLWFWVGLAVWCLTAAGLVVDVVGRLAARPAHVERLRALQDEGRLVLAGPFPAIDSPDPGPAGFAGSLIVAEFDSLASAEAWLREDPYVQQGVFARTTVRPFRKTLP